MSIKSFYIPKKLENQDNLLLTLFMMRIQLKEEYMMKVHFNWLSQLSRGIMEPYSLMDKQVVVKHIPCLV